MPSQQRTLLEMILAIAMAIDPVMANDPVLARHRAYLYWCWGTETFLFQPFQKSRIETKLVMSFSLVQQIQRPLQCKLTSTYFEAAIKISQLNKALRSILED